VPFFSFNRAPRQPFTLRHRGPNSIRSARRHPYGLFHRPFRGSYRSVLSPLREPRIASVRGVFFPSLILLPLSPKEWPPCSTSVPGSDLPFPRGFHSFAAQRPFSSLPTPVALSLVEDPSTAHDFPFTSFQAQRLSFLSSLCLPLLPALTWRFRSFHSFGQRQSFPMEVYLGS